MAVYVNRSQALAERLVKLRDYLYTNATPTHAVKAADILKYLKGVGHEVEIKTVYRDIETLRNFFGLEIDYDGRQKGYFLRNPPFEPYELRSIVNSIQAAQFITQQEADCLTQKIMTLADEYTRPSLNRQTYIPNRVRAVNEEAMRGLDIIYEAIAQDQKIRFKYFEYTLPGQKTPKKYHRRENSIVITASPYNVVWVHDKFWIQVILKIPKDVWYKMDLQYSDEYGAYIDYNGEPLQDEDDIDFQYEDMDDSGQYVYEFERIDLERMEQIEITSEKREGKTVAESWLKKDDTDIPFEIAKLRVYKKYVSDVIARFGNEVSMSPDGEFFIATIHEEPTPELYLWAKRFLFPVEIIYPENTEDELRAYFLSLAKGEAPDEGLNDMIKPSFPYDSIR